MSSHNKRTIILLSCTIIIVLVSSILILQKALFTSIEHDESTFIASNPIIFADAPDPDVIRVDDAYYMVTTSMHMMPGTPIMKSMDLVNWEIIGYPYTSLEDNDAHNMINGANIYGQGAWASSLKYFNGKFYVLTAALDSGKTYLFSTEDPAGVWERTQFNEYLHDPALFFEDDGTAYIIYGIENFQIKQLTKDYKAIDYSGVSGEILQSMQPGMEGAHAYKINDYYYITAIWWEQDNIRRQYIYRSEALLGPYEGKLVLSDTMGYKQNGVAQGGLVEDKYGQWHAMLFQDHDAVGRVPVLVPVEWKDNWPVYGIEGKVPPELIMRGDGLTTTQLTISDEFFQAEAFTVKSETVQLNDDDIDNVNIIANSRFNSSVADWLGKDGAKISVIEDNDNKLALISQRKGTYSGIEQNVSKTLLPQQLYSGSFKVKYDSGPDEKLFILTAKKLIDGEIAYQNLIQGIAKKGQWQTITGQFSINEEVTNISLFIETPWTAEQDQQNDLMDFYVDDILVWSEVQLQKKQQNSTLNDSRLALNWQWNHNPDHSKWSLTERKGYLRLKTGQITDTLEQARNTLTQRSVGPYSSGWVAMDVSAMQNGDTAGLAAFQQHYGFVGVTQEEDKYYIIMSEKDQILEQIELAYPFIYVKLDFDFTTDTALFYYSYNGRNWFSIGKALEMKYTLPHFMGYRFALFNYATERSGGYVDFDFFRFEPNLTGLETKQRHQMRIAESSIVLNSDVNSSYLVQLMLDEPINKDNIEGIKIDLQLPPYLVLDSVVSHLPNVQSDAIIDSVVSDNITTIELLRQNEQRPLFNNSDTSSKLLTLHLKQKDHLFAQLEDWITVRAVYITDQERNESMVDINSASSKVVHSPLNEAVGKLIGYGNPLVSYKFGADPYALVHEGRVYLYMTHDIIEYGLNNEVKENSYSTINRLTVISSDDLVNWTDHGEIQVTGPNGAAKWATQSWAPAITSKVIDGKYKFFLYFANNASNIGVLSSDSPLGPWVDPIGKPLISRTDPGVEQVTWLFDPAVFVDDDGQGYIYFGGGIPEGEHVMPNTARVMKLGDDMVSLVGRAEVIPAPYMFENSGINKVNGLYYYTYCSNFIEGQRGVNDPPPGQIAYMVSENPMGPWEYKGTILKNPGYFFDVGGNNHHAIFEFENQYYIAYHAQTLSKAMGVPKGYRSTHLNKVFFESDGSIKEIIANYEGVPATKALNPYVRVEAETLAWQAGIEIVADQEQGSQNRLVREIHSGDWTGIRNVAFTTGASQLVIGVRDVTENTIVELRQLAPDGEKIGEIIVNAGIAGSETIQLETAISLDSITTDIFFVFRSASQNSLMSFDYWYVK